jgi:hypothetical protein
MGGCGSCGGGGPLNIRRAQSSEFVSLMCLPTAQKVKAVNIQYCSDAKSLLGKYLF